MCKFTAVLCWSDFIFFLIRRKASENLLKQTIGLWYADELYVRNGWKSIVLHNQCLFIYKSKPSFLLKIKEFSQTKKKKPPLKKA